MNEILAFSTIFYYNKIMAAHTEAAAHTTFLLAKLTAVVDESPQVPVKFTRHAELANKLLLKLI